MHLHTSMNFEKYVLARDANGKIFKDNQVDENNPTLIENTINWSRKLRMFQETIHATLRAMCKLLNEKKLNNNYINPFPRSDVQRYRIPASHKNIPKLSYIAIVCTSLVNETFIGYQPLFMDSPQQQISMAQNVLHRLFLKNPLLHPQMWPHQFDGGVGHGWPWNRITFGQLHQGPDVIGFPKLNTPADINTKGRRQ